MFSKKIICLFAMMLSVYGCGGTDPKKEEGESSGAKMSPQLTEGTEN